MLRCLYDYTYECDIQEAFVFCFFYFVFEFYVIISLAFFAYYVLLAGDFSFTFHNGYTSGLGLIILGFILSPTILPLILNGVLSIVMVNRKKLGMASINSFEFYSAVAILLLTCFVPTIIGIFFGLVVPAYIMQKGDNSLCKEINQLVKENLEQKRKVDKLLLQERVKSLKTKEFEKILVKI